MPSSQPRRIVVLAVPGAQILDVTGPSETFSLAERAQPRSYTVELVASSAGEIGTSGGLRLIAERALSECRGPIDTLLVAGGAGVRAALHDDALLSSLRATARRARRVGSVCTGAFLLAEAGLLDGRRATTHWSACETLAERYPSVQVDPQPIFVRDGNVYTSAGITAGIDLTLALVEEDLGHAAALEVARTLVLFVRRPGGQAQFSVSLAGQVADRQPLRELQSWMSDHLDADMRVEALAERVCMSPRNFARVFRDEAGVTPARYVEALRLERARTLLEDRASTVQEVARACGFQTVETMRRTFARRLGVAPASYRQRFQRAESNLDASGKRPRRSRSTQQQSAPRSRGSRKPGGRRG